MRLATMVGLVVAKTRKQQAHGLVHLRPSVPEIEPENAWRGSGLFTECKTSINSVNRLICHALQRTITLQY